LPCGPGWWSIRRPTPLQQQLAGGADISGTTPRVKRRYRIVPNSSSAPTKQTDGPAATLVSTDSSRPPLDVLRTHSGRALNPSTSNTRFRSNCAPDAGLQSVLRSTTSRQSMSTERVMPIDFGPFELQPDKRRLLKDGATVPLRPRA